MVDRLTALCGRQLQTLWKVRLTARGGARGPGLARDRLGHVSATSMRDPANREESTPLAVPLLVLRGEEAVLAPVGEFVLAADDEILLAGRPYRPPIHSTTPC